MSAIFKPTDSRWLAEQADHDALQPKPAKREPWFASDKFASDAVAAACFIGFWAAVLAGLWL